MFSLGFEGLLQDRLICLPISCCACFLCAPPVTTQPHFQFVSACVSSWNVDGISAGIGLFVMMCNLALDLMHCATLHWHMCICVMALQACMCSCFLSTQEHHMTLSAHSRGQMQNQFISLFNWFRTTPLSKPTPQQDYIGARTQPGQDIVDLARAAAEVAVTGASATITVGVGAAGARGASGARTGAAGGCGVVPSAAVACDVEVGDAAGACSERAQLAPAVGGIAKRGLKQFPVSRQREGVREGVDLSVEQCPSPAGRL